jgi:hypothetical protein
LLFELEGKFAKESIIRDVVRQRLFSRVSELIDRLSEVCLEIERNIQPPMIVFEDIDKADLSHARDLFIDHAATLNGIACRVIYTFPISLRYNNDFAPRRRDYSYDFSLPNAAILTRNGQPNAEGLSALKEVIARRITPDIFAPGVIDRIIGMSGGLMTDLIRLVSDAALTALTNKSPLITLDIIDRLVAEMANDYQRILLPEHYEVLRKVRQTKTIVPDSATLQLLASQAVLEYQNAEVWYDVHPAVKLLLDKR